MTTASRPYTVGLTGGIGSGKSFAAEMFRALGAAVVDTDAIAHELTGPGGAAMREIRRVFGPGLLTPEGALDRGAMRRLAFEQPAQRKRLEEILHPMIRAESEARVADAHAPYVMLVVPLLVETGAYRERVDRVAVVDCTEDTQILRVAVRSGLAERQIRSIMAAQATREQRLAAADDVLHNDGEPDALRAQVAVLDAQYRAAAQTRAKPAPG